MKGGKSTRHQQSPIERASCSASISNLPIVSSAKGHDGLEWTKGVSASHLTGPLVSVIVPTRNSEQFLATCLESIRRQSYKPIELIVVDNHSTDRTVDIASGFADVIAVTGPERSAQVNLGVKMASGTYVFRVDSDFRLETGVVEECVMLAEHGAGAVVVHNTADASVSLIARVRKFEVDMYKYALEHTSARFLSRELYMAMGGLREDVTAGEDYDFQNRLRRAGVIVETAEAEAVHLDEPTHFVPLLRKYFRYGSDFHNYRRYNRAEAVTQLSFIRREYLQNWRAFIRQPVIAMLFVNYHTLKFTAGGIGYACGLLKSGWRSATNAIQGQSGR